MTHPQFPHLFSPLTMRGVTLKNRIFSTGHMTTLVNDGEPNDALVAYHEARAAGGAGLIIVEVATVHESAVFTTHTIMATSDACIPGYRKIAEACHAHGCKVFGQLFHPGRELIESLDGSAPVSFAPSATPNERFHVMPEPMSRAMIAEVVAGYGDAARRMIAAGLDGVEIVASHGYLPAQFLNPRINLRDDDYGGSDANRLRFLRQVAADIRAKIGGDAVLGMRISGDEKSVEGLTVDEVVEACIALDGDGELDYYNVIAGSSATLAGSIHIVPPMLIDNAYVAPYAAGVRAKVAKPVFVAGRINQPQIAEQVLEAGQADMCGMTRAMICDPEMAGKAEAGRADDIRACIACNQACIGHMLAGYSISCIQHPETGRELEYGTRVPATRRRKVRAGRHEGRGGRRRARPRRDALRGDRPARRSNALGPAAARARRVRRHRPQPRARDGAGRRQGNQEHRSDTRADRRRATRGRDCRDRRDAAPAQSRGPSRTRDGLCRRCRRPDESDPRSSGRAARSGSPSRALRASGLRPRNRHRHWRAPGPSR